MAIVNPSPDPDRSAAPGEGVSPEVAEVFRNHGRGRMSDRPGASVFAGALLASGLTALVLPGLVERLVGVAIALPAGAALGYRLWLIGESD
jgi:hypothetical protein